MYASGAAVSAHRNVLYFTSNPLDLLLYVPFQPELVVSQRTSVSSCQVLKKTSHQIPFLIPSHRFTGTH